MFAAGDPRTDELLQLAEAAIAGALDGKQRESFRTLVVELLGHVKDQNPAIPDRRKLLRGNVALGVQILSPEQIARLTTTSVSAGGMALGVPEHDVPVGTLLRLSITIPGRDAPLVTNAQVVWSRPGELGAAFIDLYQNDRELLEAVAVKAILQR
jgi:hypothetical protein